MNLDELKISLSAFGTNVLCEWNKPGEFSLWISIDSWNGDMAGYKKVIADQVTPTHPYEFVLSIQENIDRLKAVYDKTE